ILGRWAAEDLRFEQAEGYFQRVIREAQLADLQAEATARLAVIYLEPDELHLPVWASALLDRLEHEFASVEVPIDVLAGGASQTAVVTTQPGASTLPGARIARELRKRIDQSAWARHQAAMGPIVLAPLREPRTSMSRGARPLLVR